MTVVGRDRAAAGPAAKLRLYHEVTVARADERLFEYVDCHAQTGMLHAVQTVDAA